MSSAAPISSTTDRETSLKTLSDRLLLWLVPDPSRWLPSLRDWIQGWAAYPQCRNNSEDHANQQRDPECEHQYAPVESHGSAPDANARKVTRNYRKQCVYAE